MVKREETLEQGLNREADKKGLHGKDRRRYVGGTIGNMAKRGEFTIKRHRGSKPHKAAVQHETHQATHTASTPVKKKAAYEKPAVKKIEKLELSVKKNASESKSRGYTVYSIYNNKTGAQHGGAISKKRGSLEQEAHRDMHAHNLGLKQTRI